MAKGSNEVDEIYHRMAVIRRDPHAKVRESVAGVEAVVDWGRYTWTYPWIALGAAAAVGYLMYSSGHQGVTAVTENLTDGTRAGEPVARALAKGQKQSRISPNLVLVAFDMLFPVAVRAGQNYMLHWLEQQFRTKSVDRTAPPQSDRQREDWIGRVQR
jgi:hypothetical protein